MDPQDSAQETAAGRRSSRIVDAIYFIFVFLFILLWVQPDLIYHDSFSYS